MLATVDCDRIRRIRGNDWKEGGGTQLCYNGRRRHVCQLLCSLCYRCARTRASVYGTHTSSSVDGRWWPENKSRNIRLAGDGRTYICISQTRRTNSWLPRHGYTAGGTHTVAPRVSRRAYRTERRNVQPHCNAFSVCTSVWAECINIVLTPLPPPMMAQWMKTFRVLLLLRTCVCALWYARIGKDANVKIIIVITGQK